LDTADDVLVGHIADPTFLKTVLLVAAHEMHPPDQHRAIASIAETVGQGRCAARAALRVPSPLHAWEAAVV